MTDDVFQNRLDKMKAWRGKKPLYPSSFDKTHYAAALQDHEDSEEEIVSTAGRVMALRIFGKLAFGDIQDHTGKIQFSLNKKILGEEFATIKKNLSIGDYIGVKGNMFTTKKGEKTVNVKEITLLSKALRAMPEKWHGIQDAEIKGRQRYLDLIANEDTRKRFFVRNKVFKFIRNYLDKHDFMEVDTPMLQVATSGAAARPFITHHNALDIPLYLRISPETYLKRLIVGGYERIYELGKNFRNEGVDSSHLQEFNMLEWYCAYWDYKDNMKFIQKMIQKMVKEVTGSLEVEYQGTKIDFSGDWPVVEYRELVLKDTGIDLNEIKTLEDMKKAIKEKGLDVDVDGYVSYGNLVDSVYKKYSRPSLIQPMFLVKHPTELVPLARANDENPEVLDIFQVLVNSWEIVKAYSELVDPVEQRERFVEQVEAREAGDDETMMLEEDFILCMEYGMPPMSGLGFGVDRFLPLITDAANIKDIVYFPSLKPISADEIEEEAEEEAEE